MLKMCTLNAYKKIFNHILSRIHTYYNKFVDPSLATASRPNKMALDVNTSILLINIE